jgi:hypothetical protein
MKSKIVLVAILVLLSLSAVGVMTPMVCAQSKTEPIETGQPAVTFGWIIVAWLIYSLVGFFASGESFNGVKFAKTFLVTLIVAFIALALRITPATVVTEYGPVLDQVVAIVLNTGPGITLIYLLEKLWKIIVALKIKWEKAKELATGPGPPKSTV